VVYRHSSNQDVLVKHAACDGIQLEPEEEMIFFEVELCLEVLWLPNVLRRIISLWQLFDMDASKYMSGIAEDFISMTP
jgi:hypothetical protein